MIADPIPRVLTALLSLFWLIAAAAAESTTDQSITLTSPLEYQVVQRETRTTGRVTVEGSLAQIIPGTNSVEARILGSGATGDWQRLSALASNQTSFRAELKTPAGGWYRVEVRVKHDETVLSNTAVEHVGVGEVFVIAGQSNSANHGEEKQSVKSGLVATFSGTHWRTADDPQPGASGNAGSFLPPFGDALANHFKVPVGIVSTGVGATSVREWLPRGTRFPNPPTLTGEVRELSPGVWESKGRIYDNLVTRMRQLGPNGFRAVLWHQGESDANQRDATRTLSGPLYTRFLERVILDSRRDIGWAAPWFVALASYHTPDDTGSPEIRGAQQAVWNSRLALAGPDSDALTGVLRESNGKGVHFSGPGLREHAARWVEKVQPWLERELSATVAVYAESKPAPMPPPKLGLLMETIRVANRPAFIYLPPEDKRSSPQPWIFYAPTLPGYPDESERWMHEQFLASGIAVAGVDVGEAYGSPKSHAAFDALYQELTQQHGFVTKPCLFGRSRGGLWTSSWAIANPTRIAGLIGIYPVFDFRSYPGLNNAAPAYGLTPLELASRLEELDPINRIGELAKARVPVALIHGDVDTVVPLKENSAAFVEAYRANQAESLVKLIILNGQGHNYFEGFFRSAELVDFAIAQARAGAK